MIYKPHIVISTGMSLERSGKRMEWRNRFDLISTLIKFILIFTSKGSLHFVLTNPSTPLRGRQNFGRDGHPVVHTYHQII